MNTEEQIKTFSSLENGGGEFVIADEFMDYNYHMSENGDYQIFFGSTYKLSDVESIIKEQTNQYVVMFSMFQLFMAFVCMMLISIFAVRPLRNVERKVEKYAETKDGKTVAK